MPAEAASQPAQAEPSLVSTVSFELPSLDLEAPAQPSAAQSIEIAPASQPMAVEFDLTPRLPDKPEPAAPEAAAPVAPNPAFSKTQVLRVEPIEIEEPPLEELAPNFEFDVSPTQPVAFQPAQPEVPQVPVEIEGIDFGSLSAVSGSTESVAPEAAAQPDAAGLEVSFSEPGADATFDMADFGVTPSAEPAPEPVTETAALTAELHSESEPQAEPETEPVAAESVDEQIKVIGTLRIGIPLYNVYLNEADEWSRRLGTEVAEWALELNQRVPDSTVGLAHALAGSSATVGFHALSDIARALESALEHTQSLAYGTPQHGKAFTDAAEEIRRLLHQFAAGFLKDADPHVVEALMALRDLPIPQREDSAEEELLSDFAGLDFGSTPQPDMPSVQELAVAPMPEPRPEPVAAPAFQPPVRGEPAAPRVMLEATPEHEDFDIADAVDPDLFPIFEDEALELMPQMGGAMRQWAARPDNRSARDEVLRALHTLKGSARLAGALRLGELAHRMESEIEYLGSEGVSSNDLESLLQRFDGMQANFDALRATGGLPAAPVEAAPAAAAPAFEPQAKAASADESPAEAVVQPAVTRALLARPVTTNLAPTRAAANQAVRVRSQLLDRLVNQAGEVMITRSRLEAELRQLRGSLTDLTGNLDRLRSQLRDIELQAESQMQSRLAQAKDSAAGFDPLEFDRFTRVQELTRMMAESVNDVATVQRNLQRTVELTEDDLIAQARQTRELQRDLLRTRMVEFEGISDRLYRVIRLASKETGKQVKLDITGGSIEMDRGVLDRMTPAFEHLLRNCVAHGIELPEARVAAGKDPVGQIHIALHHEGNDVSAEFQDDGRGLDLPRIREKALQQGLISPTQELTPAEAANLIFMPGFSTAEHVTELAGRGIGMDVVRAEVNGLGGRIETTTTPGKGTSFKLVLPLTTAVTQVVMIRTGTLSIGVPANVVEIVRRAPAKEVQQAYNSGFYEFGGEQLPFYWSGALLQASQRSIEPQTKTLPVVVFRSAAQRIAVHVDEVLGNQEVVVKNLGPQLARLPGLAGMTVLASGAVVLIYNPVALTAVYGEQARLLSADRAQPEVMEAAGTPATPLTPALPQIPLILVVDDSITVRRVTQRLLQREGYRVALAADGLQALEKLAEEKPTVVLSDIEMPRMDGFDLARNIRGDARLKDLPIIMITSRIAEKHREHAIELGVDHYLGKPYSEEELLSLVKHYCAASIPA
jgi:chemosensory pili system protein ChpA (sensor histidine kinase/response regulator)